MKCSECGTVFTGKFCPECGAKYKDEPKAKTMTVTLLRKMIYSVSEAADALNISPRKLNSLITEAWSKAEWFGPVMGMIDPVKEVNGAALRIKYGLSTGEREAVELTGTDYDDNVSQIAQEAAVWRANNLEVPKADNTGGNGGENNEQ